MSIIKYGSISMQMVIFTDAGEQVYQNALGYGSFGKQQLCCAFGYNAGY